MAQNFIQPGVNLDYTNESGADITSGSPVFAGKIKGIALGDIAEDATGVIITQGVFELTKKAALAVAAGDALYWDATPGEITKTGADGTFIGYAAKSELAGSATVQVLLVQDTSGAGIAAVVAALVDNSGGAAGDGTIGALVDAGGTAAGAPTTASVADAIKELSTKLNAVIAALKTAGIMASA